MTEAEQHDIRGLTMEEIRFDPNVILTDEGFASVRRLHVSGPELPRVLDEPRWDLDLLQLYGFLTPEHVALLARPEPVPRVRELGFAIEPRSGNTDALWASPLFQRLTALRPSGYRFRELLARSALLPALRRIGRADAYGWRLLREEDGVFARLEYAMYPGRGEGAQQNLPMLSVLAREIPPAHRRIVVVRGAPKIKQPEIAALFADADRLVFEPAERW